MAVVFAEQELRNACQVLFGADLQISRGFFDYLQLSGIKSAYRKKALETHPDRVGHPRNHDRFMAVQQAYERLTAFVQARTNCACVIQKKPGAPVPPHKKTTQARRPSTKSSPQGHRQQTSSETKKRPANAYETTLYKGPLPKRKLLFGHFLYYSGLINWQTVTKALIWQRTKRPRLGEIGCRYGWLSTGDILAILKTRTLHDSFGQSAVRQGFLTEKQLRLLLFQQQRMQKKFGQYFIDHNLLTNNQINQLVKEFRGHNLSVTKMTTH